MEIRVSLSPLDAANIVQSAVLRSGVSSECVDFYTAEDGKGHCLATLVFEKYFMRKSSRASLTVIIHNLDGDTVAHAVGSGGGQFLRFDWGASSSLENVVERALEPYLR